MAVTTTRCFVWLHWVPRNCRARAILARAKKMSSVRCRRWAPSSPPMTICGASWRLSAPIITVRQSASSVVRRNRKSAGHGCKIIDRPRGGIHMMRARPAGQGHAEPVGNGLRRHTAGLPVDEIVRASWNRCINTYSLDPQETKRPNMVERADLQARRERLGVVLAIARIEMEGLGKLMEHSEYSIMLTDRDGVILSYVGDPGFSATARRCGFREGVMWSEREMGTNGMGTCLMTQRSVLIHRTDHFLEQNTQLTCSAAPIFDMRVQLLAALDMSGASSHTQTHTLALVDMAAQNVENRALLGACKEFHLLRFHRCAEFVSTPGEGVLAFDDQGTIRGANRGALKLLGLPDHESLCGQRVDRVLDTSLGARIQLPARHGFRPEALSATLGQRRWFATVHAPAEPVRRAHVAAAAPAAAPLAENRGALDCLHSADPALL